jgi:hypothetical protein
MPCFFLQKASPVFNAAQSLEGVFEKLVHLYVPKFSKRNERHSFEGSDDEPAKKVRKSSVSPQF